MKTRLQPMGDSLAVPIPAEAAAKAGFGPETPVEVDIRNGLILVARSEEPAPTLEELVARITPDNRHDETDWGPPVGREVW